MPMLSALADTLTPALSHFVGEGESICVGIRD